MAAGLAVGVELDRPRIRRLRTELRERDALARAARALRRQDFSERALSDRLARSGVAPAPRAAAVARLAEAGAIDDDRLARRRAELLAERGAGNAMIRADLVGRGISPELAAAAVSALEPEAERARRVAEERGPSLRTARYLVRRGFAEDAIDAAVPSPIAEEG